MANGLGLIDEGQRAGGPSIGLTAPRPLAAPGVQPGQAPREVDTAGAAARARTAAAPAPQAPAAKPKSRIPKFSEDPLGTIAFALSEGALAFAGLPTNLPKLMEQESDDERAAQGRALQEQGLKLRAASAGLNALEVVAKTIPTLKPDQMDAFIESLPELPGIDIKAMATAAKDGQLEGLETTVAGLKADPEAMTFLSSMDLSNKSPVEIKALADKVLAFKIDAAKSEKKADLEVDTALVKQEALAAGKETAAQKAADRQVETALAKQKALAPGADDAAKQKADREVETALAKQKALLPGEIVKAKAIAEAKAVITGKKGALKEEDGSVKTAASAEIRRQAALMNGGFIDPRTGETGGMTREAAQSSIAIAAEAERMIKDGEADSIAQATAKAAEKIGIPTIEVPEIQIPEKQRTTMLIQNAEISSLLPLAQSTLGDVESSTGTLSNLAAFADATVGQIFDAFGSDDAVFFKDTQEARSSIRLFNQEVKRAIVNNPKFPKFEQEIVKDLLPDPNVYFENPATAVLAFKNLVTFLNTKLTTNASLLQGKLPEGMKGPDAELSAEELEELEALRGTQGANQ